MARRSRKALARCWLLAAAGVAGCGGRPPATFVGQSAHFRLFVDPAATVPAGLEGENGLVALETEWSDVQTMLKMPDGGRIDYYWFSNDHIAQACSASDEAGCMWEDRMEIDAATLPNAHELNHAYMYLRAQRKEIPFLAEGIADAIGCERAPLSNESSGDLAWPDAVAALPTPDTTAEGGILVRYLIRTQGIDAFLRYYEQSPERRDPALFAANFQRFWGLNLDDVWAAAHRSRPGTIDDKICPCSLAPVVPGGAVANDPARAPYWTVPDTGDDETLALTGPALASLGDCAGVAAHITGRVALVRGDSGARRFVPAPLTSAVLDRFLADDCDAAVPYQLPADFHDSSDYVAFAVGATASGAAQIFLKLEAPFSGHPTGYGLRQVCDSCAFDQATCQPPAPGAAAPAVSGTFALRYQLYATPDQQSAGVPLTGDMRLLP